MPPLLTNPRFLAIETSGKAISLALGQVDGGSLVPLLAAQLPTDRRAAQHLVPLIAEALAACAWQPRDVEVVAVSTGPGSFTGLRIGVTLAKTMAWAVGAVVVAVDSLDVLAASAPDDSDAPPPPHTWAVLDAQRGDVFARRYPALPADRASSYLMPANNWLSLLCPDDRVLSPDRMVEQLVSPRENFLPCSPTATQVLHLGWNQYQSQGPSDLWSLVPNYGRRSAAEEKAQASQP